MDSHDRIQREMAEQVVQGGIFGHRFGEYSMLRVVVLKIESFRDNLDTLISRYRRPLRTRCFAKNVDGTAIDIISMCSRGAPHSVRLLVSHHVL